MEFVSSFNNFLIALDCKMVEHQYEKWVRRKIKEDGYHRRYKDVSEALADDERLYRDIKKNGIATPIILVMKGGEIISIDGCHRILIAKHLGTKEIQCLVERQ